jgi:hypothetical protein
MTLDISNTLRRPDFSISYLRAAIGGMRISINFPDREELSRDCMFGAALAGIEPVLGCALQNILTVCPSLRKRFASDERESAGGIADPSLNRFQS